MGGDEASGGVGGGGARTPADHLALDDHRSRRVGDALPIVGQFRFPIQHARPGVDRDQIGVGRQVKDVLA